MKEFFPILAASPLFSGVTEDELDAMLTCLAAKTEQFPKDVFLLHPGDTVEEIGMVLSGCALVVQEDLSLIHISRTASIARMPRRPMSSVQMTFWCTG